MSLNEDESGSAGAHATVARPPAARAERMPNRLLAVAPHVVEIAWIVLLMFVYGGGPAPDVNEPHYLGKAKHFWDPSFCQGDFFFQSRDAHIVFFITFGWLTQWLSLTATAWVGRLVGWCLLAFAWHGLCFTLIRKRGASLLTAAGWIALVDHGQMSGEWIIGGIEAKVVAYALVFWGLRQLVRQRWNFGWMCFGAAAAFHVLVGGWAMVMAMFAWRMLPAHQRPHWRSQVPGLVVGGVLSLLGVIPALLLGQGVAGDVLQQANFIYVFQRLPHHLLVRAFPSHFVVRHVLLIAIFLTLWRVLRYDATIRPLLAFCGGAVMLLICGALLDACLGHTAFGMRWLRFYWFRASDLFVPAAISLGFVYWLSRWPDGKRMRAQVILSVVSVALLINLVTVVAAGRHDRVPAADRQSGIATAANLHDWQRVCRWIDAHLPHDARCLTPGHQTFKWYARRAEVVSWKDVPQDAQHLVEWSKRLAGVRRWQASQTSDESAVRLRELRLSYDFDYVVTRWPREVVLPTATTIYQNAHYAVLAFSN